MLLLAHAHPAAALLRGMLGKPGGERAKAVKSPKAKPSPKTSPKTKAKPKPRAKRASKKASN